MADNADLDRRFGGLARLYAVEGARRIRAAHVVVVGLGGVGSWAAEALARSGVARLTLIDLDHIAESNINRQIHALSSTLGQSKVQAMRDRIIDINPDCDVRCVEEFVDAVNWPEIARLDVDSNSPLAVLDACDQVKAKTAIAAWALASNVHFLTIGAAGGKRQAHLQRTTHCWPKCVTGCAKSIALHVKQRSALAVSSAASKSCRLRRTRKYYKQTAV